MSEIVSEIAEKTIEESLDEIPKWKKALMNLFGKTGIANTLYLIILVVFQLFQVLTIPVTIVYTIIGLSINTAFNIKEEKMQKVQRENEKLRFENYKLKTTLSLKFKKLEDEPAQ